MNGGKDNITSLAAARKAKEQAARRAAATSTSPEAAIRVQVWVLFAAIACAYVVYTYFAGAGH